MINIWKISHLTKLLSNHYYLSEVPVEGRKSRKFYFNLGANGHYVRQIIRVGNCCTLLSNPMEMTEDNFWKPSHFDDYVRYVFWTFKDRFREQILERMPLVKIETLIRYKDLLKGNFSPYEGDLPEDADEELKWCWVKNGSLKRSGEFTRMYSVDQENRAAVLSALECRILETAEVVAVEVPRSIEFPDMLVAIDGSVENTLRFIKEKVEQAEFKYPIFSTVERLEVNKNQYGFNGCMAAMIDYFYQQHYFKKEFTLERVFTAYLVYTGNRIGKFKVFLSEFRHNRSYIQHMSKLKALKIKSLQ